MDQGFMVTGESLEVNDSQKIQSVLRQTGAYLCPNFQIQKTDNPKKLGCCNGKGSNYIPICLLTNSQCVGVPQCLKLNIQKKSEIIKQWQKDIKTNKKIDPSNYVK